MFIKFSQKVCDITTGICITLASFSEKAMAPTPVLLPGKSHGQRSLVGCSPWGRKESDTTEQLHFHFSLSCTGEGNGNPLQHSCLDNPRDGGAWWAVVYGVAQSRTRLKQLSSNSSSTSFLLESFQVLGKACFLQRWDKITAVRLTFPLKRRV